MAAIFHAHAVGFIERRQLVDAQLRVHRMPDVLKSRHASPCHPRNEIAIEFEMKLEPVSMRVVPRHDVRRESATLECGRHRIWFQFRKCSSGKLWKMRRRGGNEPRTEPLHHVISGM